jgi:hypothetical protein
MLIFNMARESPTWTAVGLGEALSPAITSLQTVMSGRIKVTEPLRSSAASAGHYRSSQLVFDDSSISRAGGACQLQPVI